MIGIAEAIKISYINYYYHASLFDKGVHCIFWTLSCELNIQQQQKLN